jgi:hypothetical protein
MQDYMLEQFLFLCTFLAASATILEKPADKTRETPYKTGAAARPQ